MQNAVKHSIDKQSIQKILAKCRRLVGHFKHSALASDGLIKKQKTLGFKKSLRVVQEVATRWNSTFYMMQRLVKLKQPIHLYLEDTMTEVEMKSYTLSDHQWSIMKSILSLLEGVDQVITTLSGERYSTLSWCLPLLFGLRDTAKPDKSDNTVLSAIKRKFTDQLNLRFELNTLEVDSPMVLSSALDPRFRKLSFLSESQQSQLLEALASAAESAGCSKAKSTNDTTRSVEPPSKKRSVLDRLLGEEKQDDEMSIQDEVKSYLQERPIKRKDDPLNWWKVNGSRFPHLESLAKKYLAIPATSTPSERVFSVAGIVVDKRRAALTPEMIDALVFLNKNSFMLGLNKECPTMPKPDLILEIDDESENEELVEDLQQDSDVDEVLINLSESDDSEA